jgi:carbonyl reductase 1
MNVDFIQLDLASEESIVSFVAAVENKYGRVDSLCNNGAIAFKAADPTPFSEQVEPTFRTNYYGTVSLTMKLLPMMKKSPGARIINVASMAGGLQLLSKKPPQFIKHIKDGMYSVSDVDELICRPFIISVIRKEHENEGWPSTCYGMSKLALIAFTKALARAEPEIQVYCCCPGWVKTEMSSNRGSKTPKQGAATPLLLLTEPPGLQYSGEFWQEERAIEW